MSGESDSDIAYFCDVTSATPQLARDYLEVSDNDVNLAVTLYLENGGKSLKSSATEETTRTSNDGSSSVGDDDDAVTSDEALARQLQDQEESRRRPQPTSSEVRAPIAPRTEILAGGGDGFDFGFSGGSVGAGIGTGNFGGLLGPHMGGGRRQQHDVRPSVFNQGDSSSINADLLLRGATSSASNTSSPSPSGSHTTNDGDSRTHSPTSIAATAKAKRLADLFRPPFDIMFRGAFEEARAAAREQSKWLLVNVQDPTEFACQVLNRDLWSDSFVKDIVRESFVFLQYGNESSEGKRYLTLYPVKHYPYVAIIDSRTGELAKSWEKQLSPTDFMMEVTEFLEHHSPEAGKSVTMKKPRQKLSDMSEEEQLNAAIAASLNPNTPTDTADQSTSSTTAPTTILHDQEDTKMESDDDDDDDDKNDHQDETTAASVLDSILPVKRQETTDIANSTRIQFRMADGSRVIRRFLKSDPVRHLFEFIKSEVPETQDQAFELVFNRQQLIDVLDQEIQEAGLQNAAVNVQFA